MFDLKFLFSCSKHQCFLQRHIVLFGVQSSSKSMQNKLAPQSSVELSKEIIQNMNCDLKNLGRRNYLEKSAPHDNVTNAVRIVSLPTAQYTNYMSNSYPPAKSSCQQSHYTDIHLPISSKKTQSHQQTGYTNSLLKFHDSLKIHKKYFHKLPKVS